MPLVHGSQEPVTGGRLLVIVWIGVCAVVPIGPATAIGDQARGPQPEQVQWNGNRIVSRVLPYADFVSLFIRLPIAHAAATGEDVKIAVISSSSAEALAAAVKQIAPGSEVQTYAAAQNEQDAVKLAKDIISRTCRVALVPDVDAWGQREVVQLAETLIAGQVLVVVPSDLSEDRAEIKTVNRLHAAGALTVGRVDRQSAVTPLAERGGKPRSFNKNIRKIKTDLFSTVGLSDSSLSATPAATAAGVAALVLQKWPDLNPSQIRRKMIAGARRVWQARSVRTGEWNEWAISVDPVTTQYTPWCEQIVPRFRFRVLDAAGSLEVDTEIPWFLNMLNCQKAWEITKGKGAVVVVSDQGFHLRHPDLAGRIKTTAEFGPHTLSALHQNFHGTEMSRILLAVAPEARIIPVLCSAQWKGDREGYNAQLAGSVAQSFEYAVEQKADVVTASWASWFNEDQQLLSAIRSAADNGVVVSWFHFPGHYPGVLKPGFTYFKQRGKRQRIGFADRFLTDPPGFHPVEIEAGLSGTAPQAAGIAALVKTVNPNLMPNEIEELIVQNSTPVGQGILIPDAYRIVLAAKEKKVP